MTFVTEERERVAAIQRRHQRDRLESARASYQDAITRAQAKVKQCDATLAKLERIHELTLDIPKDCVVGGVQFNFAAQELVVKAKKTVTTTRERAADDLQRAKSAANTNERAIGSLKD
ncbi:MAG TPA: hypothetical protein VJN96_04215 [Vicinamibacterales bacterium]|nr:hypothetical protein [Vicinamibacterales bacterium]